MRDAEFYQSRLFAVSRSFALCIPQLEQPLREQVALAYLLLRVLDTVEDAPFVDPSAQQAQFAAFRGFLRAQPSPAALASFERAFPAQLSEGERALLGDTGALLEDAHALPAPARAAILGAVDRMADGMATYARRPRPLRLLDGEDVDRYCCIVAGLVGELLTRLWAAGRGEAPPMLLAYQFGLFLQKVNILKDQSEDEAAGRFLVPDRRALLASLRRDAAGALDYLCALPPGARGYRVFCAWALMLGAASLAQRPGAKESRRAQTLALLARTEELAGDNAALRALFASLLPELPAAAQPPARRKPESPAQFRALLDAPLSDAELAILGIPAPHAGTARAAG